MNLNLFPKNEEWGTGDEALDLRLTNSLKKASAELSLRSISEFYNFALTLKTRAYNPSFAMTIEQVCKALLFHLSPDECNDDLYKKMRGAYFEKEKIQFDWSLVREITGELKTRKLYRYKSLVDFSVKSQPTEERNPFVKETMKRSAHPANAKIIFKDYRQFLNGERCQTKYDDEFSRALAGKKILVVVGLGEIWFHDPEILFITDGLTGS